jgi:hypothetical protein
MRCAWRPPPSSPTSTSGSPERGSLGRDEDVARGSHADSTAQRRAVYRANYRDRTFHDGVESLAPGARVNPLRTRTPLAGGRAAAARLEVGAGAKAFARPGQNGDAHLRQVVKGIERRRHTFHQILAHRIDGRPVHRDSRDVILDFHPNIGSVHGKSLCNRDACAPHRIQASSL